MTTSRSLFLGLLATILLLGVPSSVAAGQSSSSPAPHTPAKRVTLTGDVGDYMCGLHHDMDGMTAAQCTRACVKEGSPYALIVDTTVYELHGHEAELDKWAGERVTIKGDLDASGKVQVRSVKHVSSRSKKS